MVQRQTVDNEVDRRREREAFLRRRGIFPSKGGFTEVQLGQELAGRGWQWRIDQGRVEAIRMSSPSGSVSTRIVSDASDRVSALIAVLFEAIHFDDRQGLLLVGPIEADIVVRAPDQRVIAIGEVKGGQSQSPEYAAEFRGNLIGHSTAFAIAPYFLIIWRDVGYLWDQRSGVYQTASPELSFPMASVIAHYLPWLRKSERPGQTELALAVAHWLDDLAHPVPGRLVPASQIFAGTEFLKAIQGASILTDAAA